MLFQSFVESVTGEFAYTFLFMKGHRDVYDIIRGVSLCIESQTRLIYHVATVPNVAL